MDIKTHPEPWNLIPCSLESKEAHDALDECLALLDTALESGMPELFFEPLMPVQRINVLDFEALEPRS